LSEKSSTGLTQEEEDFMKTMQDIDALYKAEMDRARMEGEREGEQRGEQRGQIREAQTLILRLLKRRVGNVSMDVETRIRALPIDRLEELGEALLDFTQLDDLIGWLDEN
jgi:predicted transposase YdaD